jgi:integrase/recombinase XerD
LSPAAINQALTALKSFYKWFQQAGYMSLSDVLPTAAVQFEKLGEPLPRHLSSEQMEVIFQTVTGDKDIDLRDRALLAVLTHGLRAEDVSALNVGNYDGIRLRFVRKKDKSDAIVPLRQAAREHIQAYLERRQGQREVLTNESPLFLSYDFRTPGQRLGYQGIYYFTKVRLGAVTGIPNLTPHRFRHTYASELVELGIDSLLARSLTGHRSEKVFERYIKGKRLAAAEDAFFRAIGEQ